MSESPHSTPLEAAIVSLGDEEGVKRATVNNLSRLRPSRRDRYRVTVFGSARTQPGHWVYEEVKHRPHYVVKEVFPLDSAGSTQMLGSGTAPNQREAA